MHFLCLVAVNILNNSLREHMKHKFNKHNNKKNKLIYRICNIVYFLLQKKKKDLINTNLI